MLGISACFLFSNPGNSMSSTTHLLGVLESFWNSPVTEIGSNGNEIASPLVTQLLFPLAPGVFVCSFSIPLKIVCPETTPPEPPLFGFFWNGPFRFLHDTWWNKKIRRILAACLNWIMIIYLCFRNVETVGLKIHLPEGNVLLVGVNLKKKKTWTKIHHYVRCHSFNEFAWEMGISSATFDFYQY